MPQLIPDPWFFILVASWIIFITVTPKKILSHLHLNKPNLKSSKTSYNSWTWPWQ
uniref:ATP synthase complex subunit 8 n=1 Tax=Rhacophorus modestus TaxID=1969349 RepID=A0A343KQL7_9NEOB|nr:ATP synthase F0 subunit 8 [Rhacophorus modestus]